MAGLSPSDTLVGRVLAERYQILHRLGEGAMGVVYKARHVKVGRLFAVKVLHARALEDAKVVLRFEREAELAGRLRHPNVIGVVDVGEIDNTRYMVMDFVEGPDLAKLLDEAPMPPERIIRLVRQMLEGLHHAHEQGLIHRDFKPENVIVERDSHGGELPRIVDFGIALLREGGDAGDGQGRLTTNGLVLGTPHYMAPEQAVADPIDHRIDLFAMGIVIYEMLSGRLPFDGSGAEVARANLLLDPPPISKRVPDLVVDPLLEAFARRLMAKKRDARPATARAARELLDRIDRDRNAAAVALGVPVARSSRHAADTEPVGPEEPVAAPAPWPPTTRMKPTPRSGEPFAPGAPTAPPGVASGAPMAPAASATGTAVPGWMAPGAEMSPPAGAIGVPFAGQVAGDAAGGMAAAAGMAPGASPPMLYAGPQAPAPGAAYPPSAYGAPPAAYGAPRARTHPHRDTALRTPLGWQTASMPGRRRSWLIGGALIATIGIVVATALTLANGDQDSQSAGDSVASAGSAQAPPTQPVPRAGSIAPPPATSAPAVPSDRGAGPAVPGDPSAAAAIPADRGGAGAAATDRDAAVRAAPSAADARRTAAMASPPAGPTRGDVRRGATASSRGKPATGAAGPGDSGRTESASPARAVDRTPHPREPNAQAVRPRADPPHAEDPPPSPPAATAAAAPSLAARSPAAAPPAPAATAAPLHGVSAHDLSVLLDQVRAEVQQVTDDHRQELLDQLAVIGVQRAMTSREQKDRDEAAVKLSKLLARVREHKAR